MLSESDSDIESGFLHEELLRDGRRNPRQRQVFKQTLCSQQNTNNVIQIVNIVVKVVIQI